jgi:hypothetical protein
VRILSKIFEQITFMKKNIFLLIAPLAVVFSASAQAVAGYSSQTSFDTQVGCVSCVPFSESEVTGSVGQVSGSVAPGSVSDSGTLSATVGAQPVGGGGGGGGGSIVPTMDQYGQGGGEFPTATVTLPDASSSTSTMPGMPNTGLGDEFVAYLGAFMLLLGLFELPTLLRKMKCENENN